MRDNLLEAIGNNHKCDVNVLGSIKRNMCSAQLKFLRSRGGITLLVSSVFVLPYLMLDQVTTTFWDTSAKNSINKTSMDKDATKRLSFIIDEAMKLHKPTFHPRQETVIREVVRNGLLHPMRESANAIKGNQAAEVNVDENESDEKKKDLETPRENRGRNHEEMNSDGENNEAQMQKTDKVLIMDTPRNQGSLGECVFVGSPIRSNNCQSVLL